MSTLNFDSWYLGERPKVVASVAAITGHTSVAADAADALGRELHDGA